MEAFVRGMSKLKYWALSIGFPFIVKGVVWLVDNLAGDVAVAKVKEWFESKYMLSWIVKIVDYLQSYPLRSASFIALAVLVACGIGGYLESRRHYRLHVESKIPDSRTLPENPPTVRPYEYGKDPQQNVYGLFVTNPGYAAFDVHIPPVRIGNSGYMLIFRETLTQLLERDHKRFISAWLEHVTLPGLDGGQLFSVMRSAQVELMHFGIVYKDNAARPRKHRTNCSIERDVEVLGGLRVRYLNQELLPEGDVRLLDDDQANEIVLEVDELQLGLKADRLDTTFLFLLCRIVSRRKTTSIVNMRSKTGTTDGQVWECDLVRDLSGWLLAPDSGSDVELESQSLIKTLRSRPLTVEVQEVGWIGIQIPTLLSARQLDSVSIINISLTDGSGHVHSLDCKSPWPINKSRLVIDKGLRRL